MSARLNIATVDSAAYKAMMGLEGYLQTTSLTHIQKELIKIRASQINGCAFCLDMHTKDALKYGETPQRIFLLNAWRDAKEFFTEEEQVILAIAEEITLISQKGLSEETYQKAKELFLLKDFEILETKVEDGYNADEEVERHIEADIIILQTPINWFGTPWIYKKYVDEIFTNAMFSQKFLSGDGRSETYPDRQYGTGGKMQGKKFLLSATWNAPEESFNNPNNPLWKGKSADDALFNIGANYLFVGFEVLPGHHCYDIFHNKNIKDDLEKYPQYINERLPDGFFEQLEKSGAVVSDGIDKGYMIIFSVCAVAYLIAWTVMKMLVPKYKVISK